MASQNDSTTQIVYSLGSEERDIANMGLMTRHSSHTIIQAHAEANCVGTDARKKEGLTKPLYLHRPFTSLGPPPGWLVTRRHQGLRRTHRRGGVVI